MSIESSCVKVALGNGGWGAITTDVLHIVRTWREERRRVEA